MTPQKYVFIPDFEGFLGSNQEVRQGEYILNDYYNMGHNKAAHTELLQILYLASKKTRDEKGPYPTDHLAKIQVGIAATLQAPFYVFSKLTGTKMDFHDMAGYIKDPDAACDAIHAMRIYRLVHEDRAMHMNGTFNNQRPVNHTLKQIDQFLNSMDINPQELGTGMALRKILKAFNYTTVNPGSTPKPPTPRQRLDIRA